MLHLGTLPVVFTPAEEPNSHAVTLDAFTASLLFMYMTAGDGSQVKLLKYVSLTKLPF
jgi:hypothetical protein